MKASIHPEVLRFPHPIVKASKLKKRTVHPFAILGKSYVLYRDAEGTAVATVGNCPHRGALLSKGSVNADGELVCAYHAWRIRSNGTAVSASRPDKVCAMPMLKTWERHGFIWVAHPDVADTAFPDFSRPGFQHIGAFTTPFHAPLPVAIDNFSEIEHSFQVHTFLGTKSSTLDTLSFTSEAREDETIGISSARYRGMPLKLHRFVGIHDGDRHHIDWVFRFKPLHGSYHNYCTDPATGDRRPMSIIVTVFFVPVRDSEVDVHTFVQMGIASPAYRWLAPIIRASVMTGVRFEIRADADIARFAPEASEDGRHWNLTHLDKQLFVNRRMMDRIYFGKMPDASNGTQATETDLTTAP